MNVYKNKPKPPTILDVLHLPNIHVNHKQLLDRVLKADLTVVDENGNNPLNIILRQNKTRQFNFSNDEILQVAQKSILNKSSVDQVSNLMTAIYYNKDQNLNFEEKHWDYFIQNSQLNTFDKNGVPLAIVILTQNERQKVDFNSVHWEAIIAKTDPSFCSKKKNRCLLSYFLKSSKYPENAIPLNEKTWRHLFEHSPLNNVDESGWNPLMYLIAYNLNRKPFDVSFISEYFNPRDLGFAEQQMSSLLQREKKPSQELILLKSKMEQTILEIDLFNKKELAPQKVISQKLL